MSLESMRHFGILPDSTQVEEYTLRNSTGMHCKVLTYGGIISEWSLISKDNERVNVVHGFSELGSYLKSPAYFGAIIGRVAGRMSNGSFCVDGVNYQLAVNDFPNHLHGGDVGLNRRVWEVEEVGDTSITLSYLSPDGEEGYPGNVQFYARYTLNEDGCVNIHYKAKTDQATPISLTNHSYFNLAGSGDILDHRLQISSHHYSRSGAKGTLIEKRPVDHESGVSFINAKIVREALPQIDYQHGDLYFLANKTNHKSVSACLEEPLSGRTLTVYTNQECLQLYLGKGIPSVPSQQQGAFSALCLECQGYPDGVNSPELGNIILQPNQEYSHHTTYHLSN